MKARVDSGEFSKAIKQVLKWTCVSGVPYTEYILLTVSGPLLLLRTTTNTQDCILAVNAFEPLEDGEVSVLGSRLSAIAVDSGKMVDVETTGASLRIAYNGTKPRMKAGIYTNTDYPVWIDAESIVKVDSALLKIAAHNTISLDSSGLPIKSGVHMIPTEYGTAIVGTDGTMGFMTIIEEMIDSPISIERDALLAALSITGDVTTIKHSDNRLNIAGSAGVVSFSVLECQGAEKLVGMFNLNAAGEVVVLKDNIDALVGWCQRALAVDPDAELLVHGNNALIEGNDIDIPTTLPAIGEIPWSTFSCKTFFSSLKQVRAAERLELSFVPLPDGGTRTWYVRTGNDVHFLVNTNSPRFKGRSLENNGE